MATRDQVLLLLEQAGDTPLSGNEIAASLSITRAAVWKAVKALQEDGYRIEAVHKKGYRLHGDALSAGCIRLGLRDPSFWKDIRVYEETASTNLTVKELAAAGAPGGTVVFADRQTAGRGRLGRTFYSPPRCGLYFSVLLRLPGGIEQSMLITAAAAVAVCRAILHTTGLETQIKWVNDIYYQGKKLCGILTEASVNMESRELDYLVVGIGINVTNESFPPELSGVAVSLEGVLQGGTVSRSRLAAELLNELQAVLPELPGRAFLPEYKRRSCVLGKELDLISLTETRQGRAIDINENGNLIVQMDDGEIRTVSTGEVSIRPAKDSHF